jgi:hypothetical protein
MAKLSNYDTVVNGMPTTLRLTEEDAERRGLTGPAVVEDADGVLHTGVLPLSSATSVPGGEPVGATDAPVEVNAPPTHEVVDPAPETEPTSAPEVNGKRAPRAGKPA